MNPKYRLSIYLLGVGLPLLALLIGLLLFKNYHDAGKAEFEVRANNYRKSRAQRQQVNVLEGKRSELKVRGQEWESLLDSADLGSVTNLLRGVSEGKALEEFKTSDFNFVGRASGIGVASKQPSVSFDLGLSGNFSNLQEGLLVMESKMPSLVMNSMKLAPDQKGEALNLKLAYSAWSK